MAATSHPLATEIAVAMLRDGGNAVDAAIAASAVLAVVEPHMTGIGGDCFALVAEPDGTLTGINGSGRSPSALDAPSLGRSGHLALNSPHAVTVPGAIAAWEELSQRGRLGFEALLRPAIRLAREGFPVAPRVAADWAGMVGRLSANEGAAEHYLDGGRAPWPGEVWHLPALADTLELIAVGGASAFYAGQIGEEIVATLDALGDGHGGTLGMDDLTRHRTEQVEPLLRDYRGHRIVELPPANQGVTALTMMGLLERFDLDGLDPAGADKLHLEIETSRIAYADRDREVTDADAMRTTTDALLDPGRLDALAASIDPQCASNRRRAGGVHTDTVYLCVVDGEGRAVSFINSLFHGFGSCICTPRSGVMLQNRGCGFALDPAHPNAIAPGKRPMHTLIPGLVMENDRVTLAFGVMGGSYQAHGHAHLLTNLIDHGMDPQAGLDSPRVFPEGDEVMVERGVPASVVADLASRGHRAVPSPNAIGGGQAIRIDHETGVLTGGSDPRKDGCAMGLA